MNVVNLLGRVGRDPEVRFTSAGQTVANVSLATNEVWIKDGNKQQRTEWHRLVFWGKQAEVVQKYVHKGDQLAVEGKIQTTKYKDRIGNDRYQTQVVVNKMHFVGSRSAGEAPAEPDTNYPGMNIPDEDIPF
jgi:single-strand DNA-binding protein